jgi:hypothetical protein
MKKTLIKLIPYIISIIIGLLLYRYGVKQNDNLKGLLINISSSFLSIPLLFLFYEHIKDKSHKKLSKELFDYGKMQIDKEVLSIVNHVSKIIYTYEQRDNSFKGISETIQLSKDEIKDIVSSNQYLGFQVLKSYELNENKFHDVLRNSIILRAFDDEQIISIIAILKSLRTIEKLIENHEALFTFTNLKTENFKAVRGSEVNIENVSFKDRFLLLREISDDKFVVQDFGDFPKYNQDKLLNIYCLNNAGIQLVTENVYSLFENINTWLKLSGNEFIIDTKMFKIGYAGRSHSI